MRLVNTLDEAISYYKDFLEAAAVAKQFERIMDGGAEESKRSSGHRDHPNEGSMTFDNMFRFQLTPEEQAVDFELHEAALEYDPVVAGEWVMINASEIIRRRKEEPRDNEVVEIIMDKYSKRGEDTSLAPRFHAETVAGRVAVMRKSGLSFKKALRAAILEDLIDEITSFCQVDEHDIRVKLEKDPNNPDHEIMTQWISFPVLDSDPEHYFDFYGIEQHDGRNYINLSRILEEMGVE